jgi:uptake hydrogenase large subunit
MPIEGEIDVRLRWDGRRVRQVALRSTRPLAAARIVVGRTPAQAVALMGALFSICGQAQRAAAAAALQAAGGGSLPAAMHWAVPLEALQETLWRLLIDAPRALGLLPQPQPVGAARAAVARALGALQAAPADAGCVLAEAATTLAALAREQVYGEDAAAWLAQTDLAAFDAWCAAGRTLPARTLALLRSSAPGLGRSDTALMPGLEDAGWWQAVVPALRQDADFAATPTWGGAPVETGALSRRQAQPLVAALIRRDGYSAATRIAARLVELAALLDSLRRATPHAGDQASAWVQCWPLDAGEGLAAVQTARGLLLHHARLAQGRVHDWRTVAPTEWNFHPEGALASGLLGTEAADEAVLTARARLAVHALDPCVGFRIEIEREMAGRDA